MADCMIPDMLDLDVWWRGWFRSDVCAGGDAVGWRMSKSQMTLFAGDKSINVSSCGSRFGQRGLHLRSPRCQMKMRQRFDVSFTPTESNVE